MEENNNQLPATSVALIRGIHTEKEYYEGLFSFVENNICSSHEYRSVPIIVVAGRTYVSQCAVAAATADYKNVERNFLRFSDSLESFAKMAYFLDKKDEFIYEECMSVLDQQEKTILPELRVLRKLIKKERGTYKEQLYINRALAMGDIACCFIFGKVLQFFLKKIKTTTGAVRRLRTEDCIKIEYRKDSAQFDVNKEHSEKLLREKIKAEKGDVIIATACVGFFEEKSKKVITTLGAGGSIDTASLIAHALTSNQLLVFHPTKNEDDSAFVYNRAKEYSNVKVEFSS